MFTKYCNWIDIPLPIALISFLLYSIAFISTPLFILWNFPVSNHRIKTKNWIFINRKLGQTQVKCLIKRRMLVSLNPLLFFLSNKKFKLSQIRIIALCACLCDFLLFLLRVQKINHLLHSLQIRRSGIFWRVLYNDLQPRHIFALVRS